MSHYMTVQLTQPPVQNVAPNNQQATNTLATRVYGASVVISTVGGLILTGCGNDKITNLVPAKYVAVFTGLSAALAISTSAKGIDQLTKTLKKIETTAVDAKKYIKENPIKSSLMVIGAAAVAGATVMGGIHFYKKCQEILATSALTKSRTVQKGAENLARQLTETTIPQATTLVASDMTAVAEEKMIELAIAGMQSQINPLSTEIPESPSSDIRDPFEGTILPSIARLAISTTQVATTAVQYAVETTRDISSEALELHHASNP